uniref:ER-bound oxygenase mpaB/mpaB'/Rubber oxygenase catalytic domain-containing protein n=1 Tax=Timema cristinae TaxID=61476 RepID=A0A7R9DHA0_TIMCR|nr:unnamed protein product [Timema cristinae]
MLDWYEGELLHSDSRASQSLLNVHSRHCAATHKANVIVYFLVLRASQSLLNVHSRHCAATHKAQKAGLGPISQLDMSLTQFGFMGYGLLYPRKLGLAGNEDDFEGFIHFWRTIGHVLGIEESLEHTIMSLSLVQLFRIRLRTLYSLLDSHGSSGDGSKHGDQRSKRIVNVETPIASKDACNIPYTDRMDTRHSNVQILALNVAKNAIREQMDLLIESSEKD